MNPFESSVYMTGNVNLTTKHSKKEIFDNLKQMQERNVYLQDMEETKDEYLFQE